MSLLCQWRLTASTYLDMVPFEKNQDFNEVCYDRESGVQLLLL